MGKGDKKTTRGKRIAGSYGKTRPRKKVKSTTAASESDTDTKPKAKKTTKKKTEE
ncbi:30S ribosomal protein THX [Chryseobacterium sp. MFBS3-17]|uniref:30S ribosomal protein THX n=1 Tax=Chryseobacterium sp. MFBS3-17 TaxID=2886689 RepID=UPI00293EBA85|nr:30S ribosomal protein THX [Chryseobacterium sp. MFBS3-17]